MRPFDPWPVFFKREWKRCWPFITGFAVTGVLVTKLTAGFTEEDAKNSKFVQLHKCGQIVVDSYDLLRRSIIRKMIR